MSDLLGLFKDTGIFGAIVASLLVIILMLIRDRRVDQTERNKEHSDWMESQSKTHTEWMALQRESNSVLRGLSTVITEIKEMTRRRERD